MKPKRSVTPKPPSNKARRLILFFLMIGLIIIGISLLASNSGPEEIPVSELKSRLSAQPTSVVKVEIQGDKMTLFEEEDPEKAVAYAVIVNPRSGTDLEAQGIIVPEGGRRA